MHRCQTKGCSEGYATVDGVEKIRRPMCAVPKDKVKVLPNCPNVIQCCPNTPVLGGKNKSPQSFVLNIQMRYVMMVLYHV